MHEAVCAERVRLERVAHEARSNVKCAATEDPHRKGVFVALGHDGCVVDEHVDGSEFAKARATLSAGDVELKRNDIELLTAERLRRALGLIEVAGRENDAIPRPGELSDRLKPETAICSTDERDSHAHTTSIAQTSRARRDGRLSHRCGMHPEQPAARSSGLNHQQ